jgi:hypothetical protein
MSSSRFRATLPTHASSILKDVTGYATWLQAIADD